MGRIREIEFDDLDRIIELEEACFKFPWDETILTYEIFFSSNSKYYLYEEDGIIKGYGGTVVEDDVLRISTIAVLPMFQHKGIGRKIFNKLIENWNKKITLEVALSNSIAKSMYESFGFEVTSILEDYYEDSEAALLMERKRK